jgi:hypothetical protein
VKRLRWVSVLFLLGTAICVSVIPRVDSPETAFNEADAPVNLAPPARLGIRVTPLTVDPITVLPTLPPDRPATVGTLVLQPAHASRQCPRHSLQSLLCTLLI